MNHILRDQVMQRWYVVQQELIPDVLEETGCLTPKLEQLIHILEWVRIEEYTSSWDRVGRPPHERAWLANAFVAKAVLGITTTVGLIERLAIDRTLRRICGFSRYRKLPSEATFSRAFDEFAQSQLAERVHEQLVKSYLGDQVIGHISRDGTAIEARERPTTPMEPEAPVETGVKRKRGRPRKGEKRPAAEESPIQRQRHQTLVEMNAEIPRQCDLGSKCNAQGYKMSWNGYKLHIDTADCGVPISALLSSASLHDSRAAIPLSLMSAQRVTYLYDVMDAAYCSHELRDHCRNQGHVPLIDHNPRRGEKIEFDPAEAVRYNERTVAERNRSE